MQKRHISNKCGRYKRSSSVEVLVLRVMLLSSESLSELFISEIV